MSAEEDVNVLLQTDGDLGMDEEDDLANMLNARSSVHTPPATDTTEAEAEAPAIVTTEDEPDNSPPIDADTAIDNTDTPAIDGADTEAEAEPPGVGSVDNPPLSQTDSHIRRGAVYDDDDSPTGGRNRTPLVTPSDALFPMDFKATDLNPTDVSPRVDSDADGDGDFVAETLKHIPDSDSPKLDSKSSKHYSPNADNIQHMLGNIDSNENKVEHESTDDALLDDVAFTELLRQVDYGIETLDTMKEVIRKFAKHQLADATKLQEVFGRIPSTYKEADSMKDFSHVCYVVHELLLESVEAQRKLSDYLSNQVVPEMGKYIQGRQQRVQQLKRNNQQAEMRLHSCVNNMKKQGATAKAAAKRAKAVDPNADKRPGRKNAEKKKGFKAMARGVFKQVQATAVAGAGDKKDVSEEESLYLRAQEAAKKYEASVMTANHEQGVYLGIVNKFKSQCREIEHDRMKFGSQNFVRLANHHHNYFNNEKVTTLQTQLFSALETLNPKTDFNNFCSEKISKGGKNHRPAKYHYESPDFQSVFYSLNDAMEVTKKLYPEATLPKILTTLCEKMIDLDALQTEGIFRISAAVTDLEQLRDQIRGNKYEIGTKDPHVPAGMLKDWLRGLNDSLIPRTYYDVCITMAKEDNVTHESLDVFLSQLPEVNRDTIKYLVAFLKELLKPDNIEISKMNIENVSIVFAPTILQCPSDDPKLLMANSRHEKAFIMELIKNLAVDDCFDGRPP